MWLVVFGAWCGLVFCWFGVCWLSVFFFFFGGGGYRFYHLVWFCWFCFGVFYRFHRVLSGFIRFLLVLVGCVVFLDVRGRGFRHCLLVKRISLTSLHMVSLFLQKKTLGGSCLKRFFKSSLVHLEKMVT